MEEVTGLAHQESFFRLYKPDCMAALPGGGLATGHQGGAVGVWSEDGRLEAELLGHTTPVTAIVSERRGELVSLSFAGTIKVWGLLEQTCILTLEPISYAPALAVSPVDGTIVVASLDAARVWNRSTGEWVAMPRGHTRAISTMCVLSSGAIVTGSRDGTVRVRAHGSLACTAVHEQPDEVRVVARFGRGGFIAGGGAYRAPGFVAAYQDGERQWLKEFAKPISSVCTSTNWVACCDNDLAYVLDAGTVIATVEGWQTTAMTLSTTKLGLLYGPGSNGIFRVVRVHPVRFGGGVCATPMLTLCCAQRSRLSAMDAMMMAWSLHGGAPPPAPLPCSRAAALCRTLSLRRLCRPREGSVEVVEPFAVAVLSFL